MSGSAIVGIIGLVYQSDVILKDTIHGVRVVAHAMKHPKKAVTKPIATAKEVKR
jgi:hypothetical protein